MLIFPDPSVSTEYTDPNGSVWEFNGTGWVRQPDCPDNGGGGGTSSDGMWPQLKPSVDLITVLDPADTRGKTNAFYKVEDDGSLTLYDSINSEEAAYNPEFSPTGTHVAILSNLVDGVLRIWDYSTQPFTLVAEFPRTVRGIGCAWSADGKSVMVGEYNTTRAEIYKLGDNGWEQFSINAEDYTEPAADDSEIDEMEGILSPTTIVCASGFGADDGVNSGSFFVVTKRKPTLAQIAQNTQGSCFILTPNPNGSGYVRGAFVSPLIAIEGGTIRPSVPAQFVTRAVAHPKADLFAYIGVPNNREAIVNTNNPNNDLWVHVGVLSASQIDERYSTAGLVAPLYNEKQVSDISTLIENSPHALMFSPSGNYLAVQRQYSPIFIFRVHSSGILSKVGEVDTKFGNVSEQDSFFQWSANEEFFYAHIGTVLKRFQFNDGNPVYIDDHITGLAVTRVQANGGSNPTVVNVYSHRHLNRSKF